LKLLKKQVGKHIVLFYNDTPSSVFACRGILIDFDDTDIIIHEKDKEELTIIPRSKYIRMGVPQ